MPVLIYPDDDQIAALRQRGEEAYNISVDDGMYYHGMALEVLSGLNIRIVTAEKRFLRFRGKNQRLLDIRKKNLPYWNLLLFASDVDPMIVEAATLDRATVAHYFRLSGN